MSTPFYVSPEQLMRDRADFARKGIAKGRSAIALQYADGILFVAENRSPALHKVAEIYDRMAFAAVGRYNEFENLRIAGVRLADMRGYSYDRRDVTGRALANAYAQTLGAIFSSGGEKPLEVEILVAEVGATLGRGPDLPAHLRRLDRRRPRVRRDGWPGRAGRGVRRRALLRGHLAGRGVAARRGRARPRRQRSPRSWSRTRSRSPSWTGPARRSASSSGSPTETLARILSESRPDTSPSEPGHAHRGGRDGQRRHLRERPRPTTTGGRRPGRRRRADRSAGGPGRPTAAVTTPTVRPGSRRPPRHAESWRTGARCRGR